jgi:hypothetical protein
MIDLSVVVLPAPLRPEQGHDLAWADVERDAVKDVRFAVPRLEPATAR